MITWVQLNTQPQYVFFAVEKAKEFIQSNGLLFRRLLTVGQIARPCSVSGNSESANLSIIVNNSDGILTKYFRVPPHRVNTLVQGYHNGRYFELFRGIVSQVTLGAEIQINMEF